MLSFNFRYRDIDVGLYRFFFLAFDVGLYCQHLQPSRDFRAVDLFRKHNFFENHVCFTVRATFFAVGSTTLWEFIFLG